MSTIGGSPTLTASAIVAPVIGSGSHILRIDGYSRTKALGKGKFIASETFPAGGRNWRLHYYPDSSTSRNPGSVSIFLNLAPSEFDKVEAMYTISLLDRDGKPLSWHSCTYGHTFSALDCREDGRPLSWYSRAFGRTFSAQRMISLGREEDSRGLDVEWNELERLDYPEEDAFSVRCDVTVVKIFTKAIPVHEACRGVLKVKQERWNS